MNKVLTVAYMFPPIGGAGVQRNSKFVRYLPEFDYDPVVVTGPGEQNDRWTPTDRSLVRDERCYGCGGAISDVLVKLGSPLCHDCRDGPGVNGRASKRSLGALWARMEVDAYLRVWQKGRMGREATMAQAPLVVNAGDGAGQPAGFTFRQ